MSDRTSFDLGPFFFDLFAFGAGACGLTGRLAGLVPAPESSAAAGCFDGWTPGAGCPTAGVTPAPDAVAGGAGTGTEGGRGAGTGIGSGAGIGTLGGAGIWTLGGAGAGAGAGVEEPAIDGTGAWAGTGGEAGARDGTGAGAGGVSRYRPLNAVITHLTPASSCTEDVSYKGPHFSLPYSNLALPTSCRWNSQPGKAQPQWKGAGRGCGWQPGHGCSMPCSTNKCESEMNQ